MKKMICLMLAALTLAGMLSGCSNIGTDDKLHIVTTIFPEYDWVMQILGEETQHAQVTLLLDDGVDLHSYQPTAKDMITISTCDLFIYVGGESDAWVDDALKNAANEDMLVINLVDILGDAVVEEEHVEGMQEEDHDHRADEEHHDDETACDEHVWLSIRNAQTICSYIAQQLSVLDPDNAETYTANAQSYCTQLSELDAAYTTVIEQAAFDTLLVADRFPFRYLTEDYGLNYYAAFAGCSAETEASFETIVFLANKLDELCLKNVIITESADVSIANTIIAATAAQGQTVLTLDSMQGTTSADAANGATYLSIMGNNLEILQQALN